MLQRAIAAITISLCLGAAAPDTKGVKVFRPDTTHSVLGFKAQTLLFDVPGRFGKYKVDIQGDPAAPGDAKVRLVIETASVDTANPKRDDHLRSADFFDAVKFPTITFTSTQVRRSGDTVVVKGVLDMHGHTQEMEIPFQAAEGMNGAGKATWSYRATVPLDRLTFGIGAESVAAQISLKKQVELNLLLVGFFVDPATEKPAAAKAPRS